MKFRKTTHKTVADDLRAFADYLSELGKDGKEMRVDAAEKLNEWLDEWRNDDAFGTEGQMDPRGDRRD